MKYLSQTLILFVSFFTLNSFAVADDDNQMWNEINQVFAKECKKGLQSKECKTARETFLDLYEESCDKGNQQHCYTLVFLYWGVNQYIPKDYAESQYIFEESCSKGYAKSCTALASMYMKGWGVKVDKNTALKYSEKGCNDGDMLGCNNAGFLYESEKNYAKAKKIYEKSCNDKKGNVVACNNLATLYIKGLGVKTDYNKGKSLLEYSCNGDYPKACDNLGQLYLNGVGVKQNTQHAVELFEKGCSPKSENEFFD
ncbi:MAG: sel1 repeat family protein, partial [Neisseriaceae bacterium]|nr:sel1 repeat family protein [Neisseriaceae bacterium]